MGYWDHVRDELAQAAEAVGRDGTPREVSCRGDDDTGLVSLAGAMGKPLTRFTGFTRFTRFIELRGTAECEWCVWR